MGTYGISHLVRLRPCSQSSPRFSRIHLKRKGKSGQRLDLATWYILHLNDKF